MMAQVNRRGNQLVGLLVLVAIVVGIAFVLHSVFGQSTGDYNATDSCKKAVKDQLTSPSTADFSGVHVASQDGTSYHVRGNVDSDNGLGAPVRSRWLCQVTVDQSANRVQVGNVAFGDDVPVEQTPRQSCRNALRNITDAQSASAHGSAADRRLVLKDASATLQRFADDRNGAVHNAMKAAARALAASAAAQGTAKSPQATAKVAAALSELQKACK